ncbi:hypothetical protein CPB86DRAFT_853620 [Serendipita vermifera]|nr:hypothetical protein CPB86DRAFT_853620 [Serendipita vermifera]
MANLIMLLTAHERTKQLRAAFFTWVTYEMLTTVEQSVELFWKKDWNVLKVLFLVNRFDVVFNTAWFLMQAHWANAPSQFRLFGHSCKLAPWLGSITSTIGVLVLNLGLMMRVRALWRHSRIVVWGSFIAFALYMLAYMGLLFYTYGTSYLNSNVFPFTGCIIAPTFSKAYLIFVITIAFETFTIIFTMIRTYPMARGSGGFRLPLLTVLITDGLFYYFAILVAQVCMLVIPFVSSRSVSIPLVSSYAAISVVGVAVNRLFIRLQSVLLNRVYVNRSGNITSAKPWMSGMSITQAEIADTNRNAHMFDYRRRQSARNPWDTDISDVWLREVDRRNTVTNRGNYPMV